MSTVKKTAPQERFQLLARLDEKIFHIDDLAKLWQIPSPNTLRVTISRYVSNGWLYRIHRGFYAISPPDKLDPLLLGIKAMHQFAYVSTETILAEAGIIFQISPKITLIAAESRQFTIGNYEYRCRKLKDIFLYNPEGILHTGTHKKADILRAVVDLLYYNPHFYFDNTAAVDWVKLKELQKRIGYPGIHSGVGDLHGDKK